MNSHLLSGERPTSKNTKQDGRHLSKKELKLGRILDGEEIARLVEAREEADRKKAAKQATNAQRAQTSRLAKTKTSCKSKTAGKAKTSKPRHARKKAATSPIDISSDSSDYYDIENEPAEDNLELPPPGTPAPRPPPAPPAGHASGLAC